MDYHDQEAEEAGSGPASRNIEQEAARGATVSTGPLAGGGNPEETGDETTHEGAVSEVLARLTSGDNIEDTLDK